MDKENIAIVKGLDLPISTKHSIEICDFIRYKYINQAKKQLNLTLDKELAIPLRRFHKDRGHRKGKIGPGFFPQKATKEFLKLLKSLEANAQNKGLSIDNLYLQTAIANKASKVQRHGRRNRTAKRTHIELNAIEKIIERKKQEAKKVEPKVQKEKKEIKQKEKIPKEKPK